MKITAFNLIADWGKYDIMHEQDNRVIDDWRWVCAFYKGLKQGKEIFITYNGKELKLVMEMLMDMATMIVREGLGRELDFHPRNMGRDSLELYNEILDMMHKETDLEEEITEDRLDELVLPGNITELSDDELDALRRKIHTVWKENGSVKDDENAINRNIIVNNEFTRRGREISDRDELDKICEEWTKIAVHMFEKRSLLHAIYGTEMKIIYYMGDALDLGLRPAFGSPSGKRLLAGTIVSYMPQHKTYVEPFVGGEAVFYKKKASEIEVLNDLNKEIIFAFKFIQRITPEMIANLKKRKLTHDKDYFFRLKNARPASRLDRFYRFIYLQYFSFGGNSTSTSASGEREKDNLIHRINNLSSIKERLKGVRIYSQDFRRMIKQYDSTSTFFYFDPPYPEQKGSYETILTTDDIAKAIKGIRGKWILSLPRKPQSLELAKKYNYKNVSVRRTFNQLSPHVDKELLIANFPFHKNSLYLVEGTEN